MSKVVNFTRRQKGIDIKTEICESKEKTLRLIFTKAKLDTFKEAYLSADFSFLKARLKKCMTDVEIFEMFLELISNNIVPILCSPSECAECIEQEIVPLKLYSIRPILQKGVFTRQMLEHFKKNKDENAVYAKVTSGEMYRFKTAFLIHDNREIWQRYSDTDDEEEILKIISQLTSKDVFPIFWPLMSEYDDIEDLSVEIFIMD